MTGITIIEEHLCRVVDLASLVGTGIFITLLCIGVLFLYRFIYRASDKRKSTKILYSSCSIALVIIWAVFWTIQLAGYNNTHMEYTVTVDDSVSFNDFHEKYEIISIDGNEYRVKEK